MKSLAIILLMGLIWSELLASSYSGGEAADDSDSLSSRLAAAHITDDISTREISENKDAIQRFISNVYDRNLVTRFMNACPKTSRLAAAIGRTPSTLSKLKKPEMYGDLRPSAEAVWSWLQSNGIEGLISSLGLSEEELRAMRDSLELIDLSDHNIVYDELGDDIYSEAPSGEGNESAPTLIGDVVKSLNKMKGTFTRINLSKNLLSDEGVLVLVEELKNHSDLKEIDVRENMISDLGLRKTRELLMHLSNLSTLYLSGNYGPSEETITYLVSWAPEANRAALRSKIK